MSMGAVSASAVVNERKNPMNIRQIEVFKAVMEAGSVAGAAELLHISAPAVSKSIAYVESHLPFKLFDRRTGRLVPTDEARLIYKEILAVYVEIKRVDDVINEMTIRMGQYVSVAASPNIGNSIMPGTIAYFHSGNPSAHLSFQCLRHEPLVQNLLTGRIMLGVSIHQIDHPNIISRRMTRSHLFFVCRQTHELAERKFVSIKDLANENLICYPRRTPFGKLIEDLFQEQGLTFKAGIEVDSPQNARALVAAGVQSALVDEMTFMSARDEHLCGIPIEGSPGFDVSIVHLKSISLNDTANSFIRSFESVLLSHGFKLYR